MDVGVFRTLTRRSVAQALSMSDSGLADQILSYVDVRPPLVAWASASGGARLRFRRSRPLIEGQRIVRLEADRSGRPVFAYVAEGSAAPHVIFLDSRPEKSVTFKSRRDAYVQSVWLDISADLLAVGRADGSIQMWEVWTETLVITGETYLWEQPHGGVTWGHASPVSAVLGLPHLERRLASADEFGVICLWPPATPASRAEDVQASDCVDAFAQGETWGRIVQLAFLGDLLLVGHQGGFRGLSILVGRSGDWKASVSFSVSNSSAMGYFVTMPCATFMAMIGVTETGAMLCWRLCQDKGVYVVDSSTPEELCGGAREMQGRHAVATVCTGGLCWAAAAREGVLLRWAAAEQQGRVPVVFEVTLRHELAVPLETMAAIFPAPAPALAIL